MRKIRWLFVIVSGILIGLIFAGALWLVWWIIGMPGTVRLPVYRSNGAQIYYTATSQHGTPISFDLQMGMMGGMMRGKLACVSCHGVDGQGGRVRLMMYTFTAPDIRYEALTSKEHVEGEAHEPFTDEAIKRAITEGVEPDGEPLDWPMPRWTMSATDLDDLLEFLKTWN